MATTKIRSSSIEDGQVANADLSATIGVTGGQIADNAVTLAKMAGGTDGNLITYDTSGDPAYVATGSATNVLTSNGPDTAPTFQAPAAGGDNTPYFSAYVNTTYTVTSDTHVTVEMDTEYTDSDDAFDTSTYEFTVPTGKGGSYWLGAYLTAQGEASDMRDARVSIKVNDVKKLESNFDYQNNYINISCPSCFGILVLSEDDVLKVETWTFTYHSSGLVEIMGGAGSGAGAQCGFSGYRLIG